MEKADYKTKQKDAILAYIKSLEGNHTTVNAISDVLKEHNQHVGTTTIYRYLAKLVEEGSVKKYILDGVSGACFEYVDSKNACNSHHHFKCEECGKLIHFECTALTDLQNHLAKEHQLDLNCKKNILYGRCRECSHATQ